MTISGFTADSVSNGVNFVTTAKTGLTAASVASANLTLSGTSARLSGVLTIDSSQIHVFNPINGSGDPNVGSTAFLTYANSNVGTNTTSLLIIRNQSSVFVNAVGYAGDRLNLVASQITDSVVVETNNRKTQVYLQSGGSLVNADFRGIKWVEFFGVPASFSGVSFIDCLTGPLNFQYGRIDLIGINLPSTSSGYGLLLGSFNSGNNSYHVWNPVALTLADSMLTENSNVIYMGYTASWRAVDSGGNVQDALLIYRDNRARYTTTSAGILNGTVNSKTGATVTAQDLPVLWIRTQQTRVTGSAIAQSPSTLYTETTISGSFIEFPFAVDTISVAIEVRSYRHEVLATITAPSAQIGEINSNETVKTYQRLELTTDPGVTQTNTTTVSSYTGLSYNSGTNTLTISATRTISEIYDWLKLQWRNNDNRPIPTMQGTLADFSNINLIIDGVTLPTSTKFTQGIRTTGSATFPNNGDASFPIQTPSGTRVKITAPNLESGTRVRLYNITDSTEIDNSLTTGSGYSFTINWTADKTVHFKAVKVSGTTAKNYIESTGILTNTGLSFLNSQTDNIFYNEIAIDGSTITEFTADFANVQIDVDDVDGQTSVQRAYAWYVYTMSTLAGIRAYNNALQPQGDIFNYTVINASSNPLQVENTGSLPCTITGGIIKRDDGVSIIASTSNTIVIEPDRVYAYAGSGGAPTAAENATAVWSAVTRTITDKTGFSLTTDEKTAIATTVNTTLVDDFTTVNNAIAAIPTNPLLTTDTRLNNLDASINSRATQASVNAIPTTPLLASNYTPPDNASITSIKTKTDQLTFASGDVIATLNGEIVNTGLTVPTASDNATAVNNALADDFSAIQSSLNAIPTNPVLTTDSRLNQISTRASQTSVDNLPTTINSVLNDDFASILAAIAQIETTAPTVSQIRVELDTNSIFAGNIKDLKDFRGLTTSHPLVVNETNGTLTVNGKTLTRTVAGDTITYTRS
jgi:hypothetical protein